MRINPSDISVIVHGPIVGSGAPSKEDRLTEICLLSIRKHLSGAKIILSTWKDQDTTGLEFDVLEKNEDPGHSYTILDNLDPTDIRGDSSSRQIISTLSGLKHCHTTYTIKMRSDLIINGSDFIKYFEDFNDLPTKKEYKVLNKRVVTLTTCNPNRRHKFPFTISDWFFFGYTEDVHNIFDIPLINSRDYHLESIDGKKVFHAPFSTEQYIWHSFLTKHIDIPFKHVTDISNGNIVLSEKIIANNCILLNARQASIEWLKYPGAAYAQTPALSNTGLYTWNEYLHMLNKYSGCNILIKQNIAERLIYMTVYPGRHIIKNLMPHLHNLIAQTVNKDIHQKIKNMNKKTKRLVVWGLRNKYHTHRHIHQSFYKNAKKLRMDVVWMEDDPINQKHIRPGDIIIAAEVVGKMVSEKTKPEHYYLPIRDDVFYCLHNYKYNLFTHKLNKNRYINLQFFSDEYTFSEKADYWGPVTIFDIETQTLYQPWGTDLLKEEFKKPVFNRNKFVFWIGSIWNDSLNRGNLEAISELQIALEKNKLKFIRLRFIPDFLNIFFIRLARLAPAIAGRHQVKVNYLPCRTFKNISYGQIGITNVPKFKELLGKYAISGDTIEELIESALALDEESYKKLVIEQQNIVSRHTYKESIANIEKALSLVSNK